MPSASDVTLPRLWLASQSPRRAQLLESLGLAFEVRVSDAEEAEEFGGSIEETVKENARRKGQAVLSLASSDTDVVIAADTLVALGNRILSKPLDAARAAQGLRALSGRSHRVLTGLAVGSRQRGTRVCSVESTVHFRKLGEAEIAAYTATREPYDKAGGYGIQGMACLFVDRVDGSYSNVMGLPTEALLRELEALTGISVFAWGAR